MGLEGIIDGEPLGRGERVRLAAAPAEQPRACHSRGELHQRQRIRDDHLVVLPRAVPFEHGEFGRMRRRALPVAPDMAQVEDAGFARRQQFLGCKFRRGVEIAPFRRSVRLDQFGREGVEMGLVARRDGRAAQSASRKSRSANQARIAAMMRFRASRKGAGRRGGRVRTSGTVPASRASWGVGFRNGRC
jgi:hypothetical protein